jgi:hypothetical protein
MMPAYMEDGLQADIPPTAIERRVIAGELATNILVA